MTALSKTEANLTFACSEHVLCVDRDVRFKSKLRLSYKYVVEDPSLLGCDAVLLGRYFTTFLGLLALNMRHYDPSKRRRLETRRYISKDLVIQQDRSDSPISRKYVKNCESDY